MANADLAAQQQYAGQRYPADVLGLAAFLREGAERLVLTGDRGDWCAVAAQRKELPGDTASS